MLYDTFTQYTNATQNLCYCSSSVVYVQLWQHMYYNWATKRIIQLAVMIDMLHPCDTLAMPHRTEIAKWENNAIRPLMRDVCVFGRLSGFARLFWWSVVEIVVVPATPHHTHTQHNK